MKVYVVTKIENNFYESCATVIIKVFQNETNAKIYVIECNNKEGGFKEWDYEYEEFEVEVTEKPNKKLNKELLKPLDMQPYEVGYANNVRNKRVF